MNYSSHFKLTVILSCTSKVTVVDVKTPLIFVHLILFHHNHKLFPIPLFFFACHLPVSNGNWNFINRKTSVLVSRGIPCISVKLPLTIPRHQQRPPCKPLHRMGLVACEYNPFQNVSKSGWETLKLVFRSEPKT